MLKANGSEIKRRRSLKGLTQAAFAAVCKLDERTIRRAEQSESMDLATLTRIAGALGCEISDIASFTQAGRASDERLVPDPDTKVAASPRPVEAAGQLQAEQRSTTSIAGVLGREISDIASFTQAGQTSDERLVPDPDTKIAVSPPPVDAAGQLQAGQRSIQECVVLIPGAGPLPNDLFTYATVSCLPMLPVAGKPVIHWQLIWLKALGFRKFLIAVAQGENRLRSFLKSAHSDLDARVIVDREGGGVGRTVMRLLEAALKQHDFLRHALVVLGDTIAEFLTPGNTFGARPWHAEFGPVDWGRNWVLYDYVNDSKRWCLWKEHPQNHAIKFEEKKDFGMDGYGASTIFKALVGVYYFNDAVAALKVSKELDQSRNLRNRPIEMSYILNKLSCQSIDFWRAFFWADAGHPDRLMLAHAALLGNHGFGERVFHEVRVDVGRGTITKILSEKAELAERHKLIDEIDYYKMVPDPFKIHFPRVIETCTDWKSPRLVLEYYPYPSLSDLYVYAALDPDV